MRILITYDLNKNQTEVKDAMKARGYQETIDGKLELTGEPAVFTLPYTTLVKDNLTPKEARTELKECAASASARVTRVIAVSVTSFATIIGEDYE